MATKRTLIDISNEDLDASNLLYKNEMFPHSIFYLQQSVEKLVKHLGIANELIKPSDLQFEVGHKAEKIFKKLALKSADITGKNNFDINGEYQKIIDLNTKAPLSELLPVIKSTIESNHKYELPDDFDNIMLNILKHANAKGLKNTLNTEELTRIYNSKIQEFKESFPMYFSSIMTLFMLNALLTNYVSIVRYPIQDSFDNPSQIFNQDHELIKMLPYFIDCQYKNIKYIIIFQTCQRIIELK
jgi:hypothetical protein